MALSVGIKNFKQQLYIKLSKIDFFTKLLVWEGLYNYVVKGPLKYRYLAQMYLYTHRNKNLREQLVKELLSHPDSARTIKSRLRIHRDIETLNHCAEGTLGQAFYRHMKDNKIKLVLPLDAEIKNDFQYIVHRILITHDVYHALLGAKTDYHGEAVVAGFTNSQIHYYMPPLVHYGAGLLHFMIKDPGGIDRGNASFVAGWLLGKKANQLFNVDWDRYWDVPIEKVRKDMNIHTVDVDQIIQDKNEANRRIANHA